MSIEFKPGNYYSTLWFIPFEGMDLMGCLWREHEEWILRYRFRYYAGQDNDPWDGKDKKSWYEAKIPASESEASVVEKLHVMFHTAAEVHPRWLRKFWEVPVHGDSEQAIEVFTKQPWAHVKEEKLK